MSEAEEIVTPSPVASPSPGETKIESCVECVFIAGWAHEENLIECADRNLKSSLKKARNLLDVPLPSSVLCSYPSSTNALPPAVSKVCFFCMLLLCIPWEFFHFHWMIEQFCFPDGFKLRTAPFEPYFLHPVCTDEQGNRLFLTCFVTPMEVPQEWLDSLKVQILVIKKKAEKEEKGRKEEKEETID